MKKGTVLLALVFAFFLIGCSGTAIHEETMVSAPTKLDMQEIYNGIISVENMPEMLPLDQDMQLNFCGIDSTDCVQAVVAICSDGLRTDEVWLIEVVDQTALDKIQNLAQSRLTAKAEESITYSPEQYAIVQKAEMITYENYFVLLVSPEVDALVEYFRNAASI